MNWYTAGPRQRLQPGGSIVIVMTRWSTKDVTGQLLKAQGEEGSDQWEVVELPALLPNGKPVWPEFWTSKELLKLKHLFQLVTGMHNICNPRPGTREL